jgi:hypothetical protein
MANRSGDDPDLPQGRCRYPGAWLPGFRRAGSGSWRLQTPPSAHPFCRASACGRGGRPASPRGLVAQLVRARA